MSLEAQGVGVALDRRMVVRDATLLAQAGAVTAIVGPNGSGKTTLMRALSGELPVSGSVTLNGRDLARARPAELAAMRAVLAQATPLAFPFTVAEVVRLGVEATGRARDPGHAIAEALARVDLAGYGGRLFQMLSGGEQQRVHLARVLAQAGAAAGPDGPRWLLLDEPVSSLDIGHQLMVMRIAADHARAGGGVVAVMHDLNLTAAFADQVVMMQCGRIVAAGDPGTVLTSEHLCAAYNCPLRVNVAPRSGVFVLPHSALGEVG